MLNEFFKAYHVECAQKTAMPKANNLQVEIKLLLKCNVVVNYANSV